MFYEYFYQSKANEPEQNHDFENLKNLWFQGLRILVVQILFQAFSLICTCSFVDYHNAILMVFTNSKIPKVL